MDGSLALALEQMTGHYVRLRQELATAYVARPWHSGHIDRLANDLATIERQLAIATRVDRQCSEPIA